MACSCSRLTIRPSDLFVEQFKYIQETNNYSMLSSVVVDIIAAVQTFARFEAKFPDVEK